MILEKYASLVGGITSVVGEEPNYFVAICFGLVYVAIDVTNIFYCTKNQREIPFNVTDLEKKLDN